MRSVRRVTALSSSETPPLTAMRYFKCSGGSWPQLSLVMQAVNNYDKEVFNGDPGYIVSVDAAARRVTVQYPSSGESPAPTTITSPPGGAG